MKEKSNMPTGSKFLPNIRKSYLQEMYKKETDPKAANRIQAYIMRKDGSSIRHICKAHNKSYSTVRDWLVRATKFGIAARYDEIRPGPECKLDVSQLAQLREDLVAGPRKCGFDSDVWTAPLAVKHVKKRYNTVYAVTSMRDLMRRIGFPYKKPRSNHPKSTTSKS